MNPFYRRAIAWRLRLIGACLAMLFCAALSSRAAVGVLVPLQSEWRYLDNGTDPGTNWARVDFDDSGWNAGYAELGYGDLDEVTVVSYGANKNNKHVTTYFRQAFVVSNASELGSLTLKLIRDDGAVVYLNGVEIARENLPAGPIDYLTLANLDIDGSAEFTFVTFNVSAGLLTSGTNVLAVEIHQFSRSSVDISFALELSGRSNNEPTVSLTSPVDGTAFFAPADITLAASADDADGPVSRVEFFAGADLLGATTSVPYTLTWSNVAVGTYDLYAVAVDAVGARGTSAVARVTVRTNLPPTILAVQPTNGTVFAAPVTILVSAQAMDPDGTVARVEFFWGDTLLGVDTTAPFELAWSNVTAGTYQLRIVAVDELEARSAPQTIDLIVRQNAAPMLELISPTNSAVFQEGEDITISVAAIDSDGVITLFELLQDTNVIALSTSNALATTIGNAPPGFYMFAARAVDDLGTVAVTNFTFEVRANSPPVVHLRSPLDGQVFVSPATITVEAEAFDSDGMVRRIEVWEGTNRLAESSSATVSLQWSDITNGVYGLYAIAVDNKGAASTSTVATVTVRAPLLARGPYLQMGTPTAITIRWRTDLPVDSVVAYGTSASELTNAHTAPGARTEHEIRLTGLTPSTRYFYSVGSSRFLLGAGTDYSFVTAPDGAQPVRIWVLGDSGTANSDAQQVRDAYYAFNGTNRTDLWLMLGDNAYQFGFDSEYQVAVFDMYPEMLRQHVLWPAIGNHDFYAEHLSGTFPYLDIFSLPTAGEAGGIPSGTERYYSYDFANIHFVCLDSMTGDRTTNGAMYAWLQEDLAANTNHWLIAYWHHPPYSKGSHDSDWEIELVEMRESVVPLLESYGVDLVLCGHSHSYERSFLINGHYGTSDTLMPSMIKDNGDGRPTGTGAYLKDPVRPISEQGAVYVVAGSSGQISWGPFHHPAMHIWLAELGSVVLDVHGDVMDVKFLQETGAIGDSFTLIKGQRTNVLQVRDLTVSEGMLTLTWNSVPGESYYVERATDLAGQQWQVTSDAIPATTRTTTWRQPIEPGAGAFFYRIVQFMD